MFSLFPLSENESLQLLPGNVQQIYGVIVALKKFQEQAQGMFSPPPPALQLDLSSEIANAIAQEATILSPNSSSTSKVSDDILSESTLDDTNNVSDEVNVIEAKSRFFSVSNNIKNNVVKLVKPLGQVAIAASAAGLMIVGVGQNTTNDEKAVMPSQVVQTMPMAGYANPVSFNYLSNNPSNVTEKQAPSGQQGEQLTNKEKFEQHMAQQRRLQALINDHQQQVKLSTSLK